MSICCIPVSCLAVLKSNSLTLRCSTISKGIRHCILKMIGIDGMSKIGLKSPPRRTKLHEKTMQRPSFSHGGGGVSQRHWGGAMM